jgi:hypothetical protein
MTSDSSEQSDHYDEAGRHVCSCGAFTRYQSMSGGTEYFCQACGMEGIYPAGDGGPRARLLNQGPDGIALLRAQMDQEIARRKELRSK